ncbi:MAG: hypothetical protein WCI51_23640, partial [Lentisphaerota bacterium]
MLLVGKFQNQIGIFRKTCQTYFSTAHYLRFLKIIVYKIKGFIIKIKYYLSNVKFYEFYKQGRISNENIFGSGKNITGGG